MILLALCILVLAHAAIYLLVVRFFFIALRWQKLALACAMAAGTAGFIASSVAIRSWDTWLARAAYFATGAWLGLFLNLLLFGAAAAAAWFLARTAHIPFSKPYAGLLMIGGAAFFSAYGVWNAFNPRMQAYDVRIPALPAAWEGKTCAVLSDVHLGPVFRKSFLESVVSRTQSLRPDCIFIVGDLFDGMDGDLSYAPGILRTLYAPYGVYFVTGNHETYMGTDEAYRLVNDARIRILRNEAVNKDGLQIVGLSYPERGSESDVAGILARMPGYDRAQASILLDHAPFTDHIRQAASMGIGLQVSGHTHRGQLFPFSFITRQVYGGYDYGLRAYQGMQVFTSTGVGGWGPAMRTGSSPEIALLRLHAR